MRLNSVVYERDGTDTATPIDEDRARSLAIAEAIRGPVTDHLDSEWAYMRSVLVGAAGSIGVGAALLLTGTVPLLGLGLLAAGAVVGGGGYLRSRSRTPDVTVTGIRTGYWSGHCFPVDDGTIVYDTTGRADTTQFELESISNPGVFDRANERLEDPGAFPMVLPDENIEREMTAMFDTITEELETAERRTVEAPLIESGSERAAVVETFAELADPAVPDVPVETRIPPEKARNDISELDTIERLANTDDDDEASLEAISERTRSLATELSGLQTTAIERLNDHIDSAADAFALVSYNLYCPECKLEEVDSPVQFVSPQDGRWYCDTCQTEHATGDLLPRHRIKDDIVNPVWDQLWLEKDEERQEIYENVTDRKAELQEREIEQRREEIRSTVDRIRDLRSRIRGLNTEAEAARGNVSEVGEMMVRYDRLNEHRKQNFEREAESAFDEIDAETEEILEDTRNVERNRLEEAERKAGRNAELIREEERCREAGKLMAQRRADERAKATTQQQADGQQVRAEHARDADETTVMGLINGRNQQRRQRVTSPSREEEE